MSVNIFEQKYALEQGRIGVAKTMHNEMKTYNFKQ